jgi:hypothetical protein
MGTSKARKQLVVLGLFGSVVVDDAAACSDQRSQGAAWPSPRSQIGTARSMPGQAAQYHQKEEKEKPIYSGASPRPSPASYSGKEDSGEARSLLATSQLL